MKIYRSIYCSRKNGGYPLKKVEIVESEGKYSIYIYDVGFEPPFWDVTQLPVFMTMEVKSFDEAVEYLSNEESIGVSGWQIVPKLFLHVSNATIRDEIRFDLNDDESCKIMLNKFISKDTFLDAFNYFYQNSGNEYGGHPIYAKIIFQKNQLDMSGSLFSPSFDNKPTLLSYENVGAFIPAHSSAYTRNPELIGKHRMIIKGTADNSSFGCFGSDEDDPICNVYDQESRTYLHEGRAIKIIFNFFNKKESFIIDENGFENADNNDEVVWDTFGLE